MSAVAKTSVAHSCPFCGGPVELADDQIIAPCGNCGSMLRLLPREGIDSYLIEGSLDCREALFFLDRDLKQRGKPLVKSRGDIFRIHVPFYRAVGRVFNFQKRVIEHKRYTEDGQEISFQSEEQESRLKNREMNFAAFNCPALGIESMGVRTAILRLAPLTPARCKDRLFLRPEYDINYALGRYQKITDSMNMLATEGAPRRFSRALCPRIMIVYMPLWIVNFSSDEGSFYAVIDCLAKRTSGIYEGELPQEILDINDANQGAVFKLAAHRCLHCGFDLPRQKSGEMFVCDNCGRIYEARGESYLPRTFNLPKGDFQKDALFPFWMFRLANSDDGYKLKKALNMESDTIFIPAFEISNLRRASRLALSLSRAIDEIDFDKMEESNYNFRAASLTSGEASRLALPMLIAGRDNLEHLDLDSLWKLYPEFSDFVMIWLPFEEEGNFYRGLLTGQGFEKAAVP